MTQIQFNLNVDLLKESVMNSNIDMVLKSSIILVLNEYMEKERDEYLQAAGYEHLLKAAIIVMGTMNGSLFLVLDESSYEYQER